MARIGTRKVDRNEWPPYALVCELATKVKATHLGEVKLRGPNGETVEVLSYVDKIQTRRGVYRHGVKGASSAMSGWMQVACREPAISGTHERVDASMAGPLEPAACRMACQAALRPRGPESTGGSGLGRC
jgi:hypothetical protein